MDPIKRLSDLVDLSKPREFPPSITLEKTMQLLNEIHQMGSWYDFLEQLALIKNIISKGTRTKARMKSGLLCSSCATLGYFSIIIRSMLISIPKI
jgi:hypothetical protein